MRSIQLYSIFINPRNFRYLFWIFFLSNEKKIIFITWNKKIKPIPLTVPQLKIWENVPFNLEKREHEQIPLRNFPSTTK